MSGRNPRTGAVAVDRTADSPGRAPKAEQRRSSTEAILEAAERVFADFGFEGATTKRIADEAGIAPALLHYYFQTKEKLYEAVFTRRASSINAYRSAVIERLVAAGRPSLEDILDILFSPGSEPLGRTEPSTAFSRMVSAVVISDDERSRDIMEAHYDAIAREFIAAFRLALPTLSEEGAVWSYLFAHAARMLVYARTGRSRRLSGVPLPDDEVPAAVARLKAYAAAGIRGLADQPPHPPRKGRGRKLL